MKTVFFKTISVITFLLSQVILCAQSPQKMSYQAVIRNSSNALVTNTTVAMRISIVQGSIYGASVYVETQTLTSNQNGLVSAEIGMGNVVFGSFTGINWGAGPYFIKTETDPTGGVNYSITGTSQLMSVPYALYAKKAENGFSGNYNDLTNKPLSVSTFSNDAGYLTTEVDGSITNEIQTLARSGNTITLSNGGGSFVDSVNTYTAGSGIKITGNTISTNPSVLSVHYLFSAMSISSYTAGLDIPWVTGTTNPPSIIDADYSVTHGNSEITINSAGTYMISYNVTVKNTTVGSIGNSTTVWLMQNAGTNYIFFNGTNTGVYTGVTSGASGTASMNTVYTFTAGTKIKLNVKQDQGNGTLELVPHGSRILITKLK